MGMDILSTGQKIKRARIYKGITLKELCGDKISISKMSCIENGKIKADEDILKYISKKIDIDHEFLMQDVCDQLLNNLNEIKQNYNEKESFEQKAKENLNYAIEYEYYDLAFEYIHIMFLYYLDTEKYTEIEALIPDYYCVYQKIVSDDKTICYHFDLGLFYLNTFNYNDALVYLSRISKQACTLHNYDQLYIKSVFYQAVCYYMLEDFGKSYEMVKMIIDNQDLHKMQFEYGKLLSIYNSICIRFNYNQNEACVVECQKCLEGIPSEYAIARLEYGRAYFYINNSKMAIEEMNNAIDLYPKEDRNKYADFINKCIQIFDDNNEFERAYILLESNLNLAIESQNLKLIEKSYFLKSRILEKLDRLREAEIYGNLSLDSLMKVGTIEERYSRYLDLANLYYKLNNVQDSIKYFNFTIDLEKII
jgi:transcriptional regulator with XRE-family HTH domain